jgi:hypothetical protein
MQFLQFQMAGFFDGIAIPFGYCKVYLTGTATLASLFDSGGSPMSNPAHADSSGQVGFAAADGLYDFQPYYADGTTVAGPKILKQQMFDLTNISSNSVVVATRTALAAVPAPTSGMSRYLAEAGREGWFVFSNANLAALVTADPQQGIYVAPSGATSGASGAWVRKFDGDYHARWWGFVADNSAGSASANGTAGQAAINMVATVGGAALRFPVGVAYHTGLIFKNKIQYRGSGRDTGSTVGTVLLYTGTGDGVQVNNPINSSTAANISVEGITFKNANRNAGKGCFADTGSTDIKFRLCAFIGGDRQLIFDQTELADVSECDFEITAASSIAGVWIVNGADRTLGASGGFSNRISVSRCQINGAATAIGIVDDGGSLHTFQDNNLNSCLKHIRFAGVVATIIGGEFESAAGANVSMESTTLAGGASGGSFIGVFGGFYSVTSGQAAFACGAGAGRLSLDGHVGFSGGGGTNPVTGSGNVFALGVGDVANLTSVAIADGFATETKRACLFVSAMPASGVHQVGEVVFNSAPVAAGKIGWVCVTAGSPGTWKAWGVIDA